MKEHVGAVALWMHPQDQFIVDVDEVLHCMPPTGLADLARLLPALLAAPGRLMAPESTIKRLPPACQAGWAAAAGVPVRSL